MGGTIGLDWAGDLIASNTDCLLLCTTTFLHTFSGNGNTTSVLCPYPATSI